MRHHIFSKLAVVFTFLFFAIIIKVYVSKNKHDQSVNKGRNHYSNTFIPIGYSKVWEDQFNEEVINPNYWVVGSLKDSISGDMVPGAKGEHLLNWQYCGYITKEDSYIERGALVLRSQKRSYRGDSPKAIFNYTSGWVMTMHRVFMNKGYIQIKAKFPSGDKVWPAIWLISEDLKWGPEWDMFEYFGYREDVGSDNMGMHLCYGQWPNEKWENKWINQFNERFNCEDWHTYGFEWNEYFAKWYIDGKLMHQLNANEVDEWPDEDMYIVLNNGQRTHSPDTGTTWPNYFIIDYIELYQIQ